MQTPTLQTYVCYMSGMTVLSVEETGAGRKLDALTIPQEASSFYFLDAPARSDIPGGDVLGRETNLGDRYIVAATIIDSEQLRTILHQQGLYKTEQELKQYPQRDAQGKLSKVWVSQVVSDMRLKTPWHAIRRDGSITEIRPWVDVDEARGQTKRINRAIVVDLNKNIMMIVPDDHAPRMRTAAPTQKTPKP